MTLSTCSRNFVWKWFLVCKLHIIQVTKGMTSSIVSFYQGLSLVQVSNSYPTWKLQFQEVSALPWSHGRKCFRGPELKLPERFSFIKRPEACNFIKKETLAQVFSCEFWEISKSNFFTEHAWATPSGSLTMIKDYRIFVGKETIPMYILLLYNLCLHTLSLKKIWRSSHFMEFLTDSPCN